MLLPLEVGESWIVLQFSTWATTDNFLKLRQIMFLEVQKAFAEHGIRFAFPRRVVQVESGDLGG